MTWNPFRRRHKPPKSSVNSSLDAAPSTANKPFPTHWFLGWMDAQPKLVRGTIRSLILAIGVAGSFIAWTAITKDVGPFHAGTSDFDTEAIGNLNKDGRGVYLVGASAANVMYSDSEGKPGTGKVNLVMADSVVALRPILDEQVRELDRLFVVTVPGANGGNVKVTVTPKEGKERSEIFEILPGEDKTVFSIEALDAMTPREFLALSTGPYNDAEFVNRWGDNAAVAVEVSLNNGGTVVFTVDPKKQGSQHVLDQLLKGKTRPDEKELVDGIGVKTLPLDGIGVKTSPPTNSPNDALQFARYLSQAADISGWPNVPGKKPGEGLKLLVSLLQSGEDIKKLTLGAAQFPAASPASIPSNTHAMTPTHAMPLTEAVRRSQ